MSINPVLARLNSTNIINNLPTTFTNIQNNPLIKLATLTSSSLGTTLFNQLNGSYLNGNLALNQYGSLLDPKLSATYFTSPFEPTSIPSSTSADIISGGSNPYVYGNIGNFPSSGSIFSSGTVFVSPVNAKWILHMGQKSVTIFFNTLNNKNLSLNEISANINKFCSIINNADPMCFCNTSNQICTDAAIGSSANSALLSSNSPSDYANIKKNCACLNAQCQFASSAENNLYSKSMGCSQGATACGANFIYGENGVISQNNKNISQQCGLGDVNPPNNTPPNNTPPNNNTQKHLNGGQLS